MNVLLSLCICGHLCRQHAVNYCLYSFFARCDFLFGDDDESKVPLASSKE